MRLSPSFTLERVKEKKKKLILYASLAENQDQIKCLEPIISKVTLIVVRVLKCSG